MTDSTAKNTYVKQRITDTMLELLQTHELKSISISYLVTTAQVSRISFYRNYSEKEDVLREYINTLILGWHVEYENSDNKSEEEMLGSLFAHFSNHGDFYLLLSQRQLFHLLKEVLKTLYGPKPEYPNFGAYVAAYFSYGLFGWIEEWFARGMQESAEDITMLLKSRK